MVAFDDDQRTGSPPTSDSSAETRQLLRKGLEEIRAVLGTGEVDIHYGGESEIWVGLSVVWSSHSSPSNSSRSGADRLTLRIWDRSAINGSRNIGSPREKTHVGERSGGEAMLDWMKRRVSTANQAAEADVETPMPQGRVMSGKYLLLYKYLEERYATTVVLTFAEIEDLLGFALPDQARLSQQWWTDANESLPEPHYSDAWTLARRTAAPKLQARTVVFERRS
jgi:hypothetical protein